MASTIEMTAAPQALAALVRRLRNRWRLKLAMHGLAVVLGAAAVGVVIGPWLMAQFHFNPAAIILVRVLFFAVLAWLGVRYLVLPLRRRVTDTQVALYLEERSPGLDEVVVSAVEAVNTDVPVFARSPHFVARLVDTAVTRVQAVGEGAQLENRSLAVSGLILLAVLATGLLLLRTSPGKHAGMLNPMTSPLDRPFFITVQPGNAEVTKGGDQAIRARLHGFTAKEVTLAVQRSDTGGHGAWERLPMTVARDSGGFELRLFNIRGRTNYYIEANGVKSPTFHLEVVELPYVSKLGLELHYPAYTGLPVEVVDQGGDIAALEGTTVQVHARTTKPVKGGRIVLDGNRAVPMTLNADGTLTGAMKVTRSEFYRIELETTTGQTVPGSLDYAIDMQKDQPPTVEFTKGGKDARITAVEELPIELNATDDYGLNAVELHYQVNGGADKVIPIATGKNHKEVLAPYTVEAEKLGIKPGDMVSFYAQAKDNNTSGKARTARSDIYFLEVRSFENTYQKGSPDKVQKPSQPKAPGASPLPADYGEYARRQRQILSATFATERDRADVDTATLSDNINTVLLSQTKLRKNVETFAAKFKGVQTPEVGGVPVPKEIGPYMKQAAEEMKAAEELLNKQDLLGAALGPQQRALQQIRAAEELFKQALKGSPPPPPQIGAPPQLSKKNELDPAAQQDLADLFGLKEKEVKNKPQVMSYTQKGDFGKYHIKAKRDLIREKLLQLSARVQDANERQFSNPLKGKKIEYRATLEGSQANGGVEERDRSPGDPDQGDQRSSTPPPSMNKNGQPDVLVNSGDYRKGGARNPRKQAENGDEDDPYKNVKIKDKGTLTPNVPPPPSGAGGSGNNGRPPEYGDSLGKRPEVVGKQGKSDPSGEGGRQQKKQQAPDSTAQNPNGIAPQYPSQGGGGGGGQQPPPRRRSEQGVPTAGPERKQGQSQQPNQNRDQNQDQKQNQGQSKTQGQSNSQSQSRGQGQGQSKSQGEGEGQGQGQSQQMSQAQQQSAQQQQMAAQLRQMADQADAVAQQMAPLARQNPNDRDLQQSLQQLQQVAKDLRKAADQGRQSPELVAAAAQRLNEARQLLDRSAQKAEANNAADAAQQLADQIQQQQQQIEQDMQKLAQPGTPQRAQQEQAMADRKDALKGEIDKLQALARKIAADNQKVSPEAARQFQGVVSRIQDNKLKDLIDFSKSVLSTPDAGNFERQITAGTQQLAQQVAQAMQALQKAQANGAGQPVDSKLHDLVNKATSLADRMQQQQQRQPLPPPPQQSRQNQQQQDQQQSSSQPQPLQKARKQKAPPTGSSAGGPGGDDNKSQSEYHGGPKKSDDMTARITRDLFTQQAHALKEQAQALRQELQKQQIDATDLGKAIQQLDDLERGGYDKQVDAEGGLQAVVQQLKDAEFAVRRQLEKDAVLRPTLGGNPDVPADYQPLVAEYYKSLSDR